MIIVKGVENTRKKYKEENVYNAYICFWTVIYTYYTYIHILMGFSADYKISLTKFWFYI